MNLRTQFSNYKRLFVAISVILLASQHQVFGQQVTSSTLALDKYDDLYNIIFPKVTDTASADHEYLFDIRTRPSFHAPSQVSVLRFRDGKIKAWIYELQDGKRSLGDQVTGLLQNESSHDLVKIAKNLRVFKTVVEKPEFLLPRVENFFRNNTFRKQSDISLDGVGWDIWYVDASTKVQYSIVGGQEFEKGEARVITWARNLLKEIEANK